MQTFLDTATILNQAQLLIIKDEKDDLSPTNAIHISSLPTGTSFFLACRSVQVSQSNTDY